MSPIEFNLLPAEVKSLLRGWIASESNTELENVCLAILEKMVSQMAGASAEKLREIEKVARAFEAKLAEWNIAIGSSHSKNLVTAERTFREFANDIRNKLSNPENIEGEEWKND